MPLGMLGKYERLDVLGHGASGIVYLAKDTLLGRQIALKEISAQGEERERVLEEARVLDRLRHPNIVDVYGVDEIGGKVVLAMEYVRGKNLQDILRRAPQLPVTEAVEVAAQVCDGLAYAHQHRIVHRDVKPANILIASDGTVKLVDFGLAQVLGTNSFAGGAGTYAYMAPEDFHEEQQSDHQSDIWAVGVILYEMLAGRRPFQAVKAKDPFSWKRAVEESPLLPVGELREGVPPALDRVLACALARDKQARYRDAAEMAADLRALGGSAPAPFDIPRAPVRSDAWAAEALPDGSDRQARWTLFPGEPPLEDIDAFLLGAPDHWEAARSALASGALAHWLTLIGETPLGEVAREIGADEGRDTDDGLRDFLYRAGLETTSEARRAYEEGVRLSQSGRYLDAIAPLRRAVRLDPARPQYFHDLAGDLRACGDSAAAAAVLQEALRHHPQQRVIQKQHADLTDARATLSTHAIDFGTLREGQSRAAVLMISNEGGGIVEGRVSAAPGWVHVDPPSFSTRRRQRLTLTAQAAPLESGRGECDGVLVLDMADGRQEVALHASVVPRPRSFGGIFWWYVPLLACCLLPALVGQTGYSGARSAAGMAATALLCAALFVLACAADTTWRPRLLPLFLFGLATWGASPLARDFAAGVNPEGRLALIQAATPALGMLVLQSFAVYTDPRRWGQWRLWGWILAATGLLITYGLAHARLP